MRYFLLLLISLFVIENSDAQIYEVGIFAGGSNFIGDIGSTDYISPNRIAYGGIIKWNRSARHSFRATLLYTRLEGYDSKSNDPRRIERDYKFSMRTVEFSAGMEFTFWDFNLHQLGYQGTPYIYSGISALFHPNYYFISNGTQTRENTMSLAYGIPIVLGYKQRISNNLILAGEIGARYTFSDELDGSVPDSENREQFSFGNTNSNDWYVFSGITLTYTFGRRPCYCNF
ncbi:hypothetical protein H8K90_13325 [Winogradskyella echinorum]|uniref:DUF6089 domain-containing protein n=1 Tax=Winogradskyella echinorum TaxID=538189 RepID=A0ABR6Y3R5_9FLAO|nr:DUF6089 family protein [Winogradskyella echinorum]MBC3847372.1 hypothetical protein [Winogradskyella echinorum]MBC5751720.1 hypothetical protein [Winogradskyella echinorum]